MYYPFMIWRFGVLLLVGGLVGSGWPAEAMWVKLSEAELVDQSDLIVSAELIGETHLQLSPDQPKLTVGVLRVGEVLKGDPSQTVALLALPSPEAPRSSADILYRRGQRGLWLLRRQSPKSQGIYLANHPQRFIPASRTDEVNAIRAVLRSR
jgi:hypothetical protein